MRIIITFAFLLCFLPSDVVASGVGKLSAKYHPIAIPDKDSIDDQHFQTIAETITEAVISRNRGILRLRNMVLKSTHLNRWMQVTCDAYQVDCSQDNYRRLLLQRLELLMPSDVLARVALSSNWGRTREAVKGHNYFGLLCDEPLCGFKVGRSSDGPRYAAFSSPVHALDALAHELYVKQDLSTLHQSQMTLIRTDSEGNIRRYIIDPQARASLIETYELYGLDKKMFDALSINTQFSGEDIARFSDYLPPKRYALLRSDSVSN